MLQVGNDIMSETLCPSESQRLIASASEYLNLYGLKSNRHQNRFITHDLEQPTLLFVSDNVIAASYTFQKEST